MTFFKSKLLYTHIYIWNSDTGVDQADVVYWQQQRCDFWVV